jgi:hypothetical protein
MLFNGSVLGKASAELLLSNPMLFDQHHQPQVASTVCWFGLQSCWRVLRCVCHGLLRLPQYPQYSKVELQNAAVSCLSPLHTTCGEFKGVWDVAAVCGRVAVDSSTQWRRTFSDNLLDPLRSALSAQPAPHLWWRVWLFLFMCSFGRVWSCRPRKMFTCV